jgi:hypothetical protein
VTTLRETLATALRGQFQREMARGRERLTEGIAPYSRFVRAEQQSLTGLRETLMRVREALTVLKGRVTALR